MSNSHTEPFLKTERDQTDISLVAERDKTNESISKSRTKTESQTDSKVDQERAEADKAESSSRNDADSQRDLERDARGYNIIDELKSGDERLQDERRRADKAIKIERSKVDDAMIRERELKRALATRLLEQERKLTDKNLSFERNRTDTEVLQASTLLTEEIAKHLKTQTSLTTRDEFLAIVSHDLRNPIGAASSCAEMLLEDPSFKELTDEAKHWIEFIKRNVDTSLRLIGDLLDMERIAAGKLHLELKNNDVAAIIRESIESYAHVASAKTILLRATPATTSFEIVCDHDRILQILSNLLGNALKFTAEGGFITVSATRTKTELQVSVKDTGSGIADEKKLQIFERFAQIGSNDRRGLGLGLYISKMLIEAHGGRLWVESTLGQGSTFHFAIPLSS